MSMYGDLLDKLDDSMYIKIQPGKPLHVRLLDHPWISQRSYTDQELDPTTGEIRQATRIVTQFHWPVWDYAQQRIRILSQGKSVFQQIANAHQAWPNGESMPSVFDLIITRTGTGRNDTEYTVSAIPQQGVMPTVRAADLPDMAKASQGIPIKQVLEGQRPQVLPPRAATGAAPQPKPPTHVQAAALAGPAEMAAPTMTEPMEDNREPTGDDILPDDDLNTGSRINLDEIPFNHAGEGR
jgi:hypothetical protein